MPELPTKEEQVCTWTETDPDFCYWATDCSGAFSVTEGKPSENNMKFCCYCGKPLKEVPWVWPKDEDDE